jgi:YggT family protein
VDEEHVVERQSVTTASPTPVAETPVAETPVTETPVAPAPVYQDQTMSRGTVVSETVRRSPSGAETARRVIVFLFGLVQALIGVRIILLLADANQGNSIVKFIYDLSAVFVAPFEGVLHTNAIRAGVSILDIAALVALVGWTILEVLIIAGIGIMRREP